MKKVTQPKQLRLATETLRKLDDVDLLRVAGGSRQSSHCNSECLPGCTQY